MESQGQRASGVQDPKMYRILLGECGLGLPRAEPKEVAESLSENASSVTGAKLRREVVGQEHGAFGLGWSGTALGLAL